MLFFSSIVFSFFRLMHIKTKSSWYFFASYELICNESILFLLLLHAICIPAWLLWFLCIFWPYDVFFFFSFHIFLLLNSNALITKLLKFSDMLFFTWKQICGMWREINNNKSLYLHETLVHFVRDSSEFNLIIIITNHITYDKLFALFISSLLHRFRIMSLENNRLEMWWMRDHLWSFTFFHCVWSNFYGGELEQASKWIWNSHCVNNTCIIVWLKRKKNEIKVYAFLLGNFWAYSSSIERVKLMFYIHFVLFFFYF